MEKNVVHGTIKCGTLRMWQSASNLIDRVVMKCVHIFVSCKFKSFQERK